MATGEEKKGSVGKGISAQCQPGFLTAHKRQALGTAKIPISGREVRSSGSHSREEWNWKKFCAVKFYIRQLSHLVEGSIKKQTKPGCRRSCVWRVLSYELACRDWAALGTLRLSRDSTLHLLKAVPCQLLASAWWFLLSAFDHGWVSSLYLLSYDSITPRERLFGLDLLMKDWVLGEEGVRTRGLPRWGIQTFCSRMWGPGVVLVNLYVMGLCWPADSLSSKEP